MIHLIPSPNPDNPKLKVTGLSWDISKKQIIIAYNDDSLYIWNISKNSYDTRREFSSSIKFIKHTDFGTVVALDDKVLSLDESGMIVNTFDSEDPITAANIQSGRLYLGNGNGSLIILDLMTFSLVKAISDVGAVILQIALAKESQILLSLKDRTIRFYLMNEQFELELRHKFIDVIHRSHWVVAGFSPDGELAFGSAKTKGSHNICLWEVERGTIFKTLEGPREDLIEAKWNPKRPLLASLSKYGTCYLWKPIFPKKWSALFPDMEEIEENVEYVEREDEFDEVQDEKPANPADIEPDHIDIVNDGISESVLAELRLFN